MYQACFLDLKFKIQPLLDHALTKFIFLWILMEKSILIKLYAPWTNQAQIPVFEFDRVFIKNPKYIDLNSQLACNKDQTVKWG